MFPANLDRLLLLAQGRPVSMPRLSMRFFRAAVAIALSSMAIQAAALAADLSVSILKVDPSPAAANADFTVVFLVENASNDPMTVIMNLSTDRRENRQIVVPAHSTTVQSFQGRFQGPGQHTIEVKVARQTDRFVLVPVGPNGPLEKIFLVDSQTSATGQLMIFSGSPASPVVEDLSPNEPVGTNGQDSAAGVIAKLAGGEGNLFAVGKTAGVWRSTNGSPWKQLPSSPQRAFCIAVNPDNPSNIMVGERDDDTTNPLLGRSGLWESRDNGNSWAYIYDPGPETGSQAINAIAFAPGTQTLFIATRKGVGRRPLGNSPLTNPSPVEYPPSAAGIITAIVASESKVWARTATALLVSSDDGVNWASKDIPKNIDLPGFPAVLVNADNTAGRGNGNDRNSLGAFDHAAFLVFSPEDGSGNNPTGNRSPLLIYDPDKAPGQQWKAQFTNDNDGRGLGGTRFVRSVILRCPGLGDSVGRKLQLFYGSAQGLQQALSMNADKSIQWDDTVLTNFASLTPHRADNIHPDIWDFQIGPEYCPPTHITAWVASDGGVFKAVRKMGGIGTSPNPDFVGLIAGMNWVTQSDGLHTHNIHGLSVVRARNVSSTLIAYPTADNDGWWRTLQGQWKAANALGDANWVAGDGDTPIVMVWRQLGDGQAFLTAFDATLPDGSKFRRFTLKKNDGLDGPTRIQFIPTLENEAPPSTLLDAVMLVNLPLQDSNGNPIPDPAGATATGPRVAIIRNKQFAQNPDGPASKFADWRMEVDSLPAGVQRFWVSGGHQNPTYYLYANNLACASGLYVRVNSVWSCTLPNVMPSAGTYGPVFVNPYAPQFVFAARSGGPPMIVLSRDGGNNFCDCPVLTALVTASGRYPLSGSSGNGDFSAAGAFGQLGGSYHGGTMGVPSAVAFNRFDANQVVVASPYTGLFFGNLRRSMPGIGVGRSCEEPAWKDLTPYIPPPLTYISSLHIDNLSVYAATEGRGLLRVTNPDSAQPASFFEVSSTIKLPEHLATLRDAHGAPLAWGRVFVSATDRVSMKLMANQVQVRSDANGRVFFPFQPPTGEYIIELEFAGDGSSGSSSTRFIASVR